MNTLKTLKDLEYKRTTYTFGHKPSVEINEVNVVRLRDEAKKWFTEFENNEKKEISKWIKHFFNL